MSQNLQSTVLTGAKQTMAAWSRVIESREDVPAVYKNCFDEHFGSDSHFPYVILTPPLDKFARKTTEKLVCDAGDAIYIFERNGSQIDASCYPYRDIYGMEMGIILLDSWLTIRGKTSQGQVSVATIQFNTTSMRHFASILNKLRSAPQAVDEAQIAIEKDKFDYLSAINFKFMNYGRESLIPGETVLQILLQPEIRRPLWTIFGKTFYKTVSLAHLAIITDRELILIRDAERSRKSQLSRYGGVWQFFPLSCLDTLTLLENADKRLTLSIQCRSGQTIEKLFEASRQPELEQFCSQLQTLIDSLHATV